MYMLVSTLPQPKPFHQDNFLYTRKNYTPNILYTQNIVHQLHKSKTPAFSSLKLHIHHKHSTPFFLRLGTDAMISRSPIYHWSCRGTHPLHSAPGDTWWHLSCPRGASWQHLVDQICLVPSLSCASLSWCKSPEGYYFQPQVSCSDNCKFELSVQLPSVTVHQFC